MRILFFTHYFPPEVNAPASRTYELCKRWVAMGHEVTVLTCAPNAPDGVLYEGYRNRLSQWETVDGIRVCRVWTFLAANKGKVKRMLNYLSFMCAASIRSLVMRRPEIIIATSPQLFCGFAGFLSSFFRRSTLVLEVRDMFAESVTSVTSAKDSDLLVRFFRRAEFWLYRRGERVVTVGPGYRRKLIEGGVPEEKISIVTNGVDREFFSPKVSGEDVRQRWGLEGKFVCTYAGTIGMTHALDVVLRAGERLRAAGKDDIVFLLVGEGAERETLEKRCGEAGLENVRFVGKQPKKVMPAILAASDCCLVHLIRAPLYRSVLPSKIFEMAYMKRPIIMGVEGDAAELIENSGGGICIEPENEEQLLDAVMHLLANPARCQLLGERGHAFVAENYDRDVLAEKYAGILEALGGQEVESLMDRPEQQGLSR